MQQAVKVCDLLHNDRKGLAGLIRWETDAAGEVFIYYTGRPDRKELIASTRIGVDTFELFPPGDTIRPARCFLGLVVLGNLDKAGGLFFGLQHQIKPDDWEPFTVGWPRNLLGALWLEFAEAYAGKELRQCVECKKWFAVRGHLPRSRSDVRYCSVACRNRAYRSRQEQARRMRAEGKSPRAIAKELGSDLETIKRWLSTGKE
jgi:hypothetical protein